MRPKVFDRAALENTGNVESEGLSDDERDQEVARPSNRPRAENSEEEREEGEARKGEGRILELGDDEQTFPDGNILVGIGNGAAGCGIVFDSILLDDYKG